jgi:hypothetical protein
VASEFDASVSRTETNAIAAMGRDGLSVHRPTQAQIGVWQTEINNIMPSLLGSIFDRDIYNRIIGILERSRSGR